ncbi:MAG: response regulator [Thaumarchaeota archaeon]|nr:MAG: response regulator [Nitrososphaerota archaeon]
MKLELHLKVLAVDDTLAIVKLIEVVLSSRGYLVETAQDGPTALRRYDQFKPDIVTLDLTMPGMSGYETLTKILEKNKRAIVIILTANDEDVALQECMKRGAAGYVNKPFKPSELVDALQTAAITAGIE